MGSPRRNRLWEAMQECASGWPCDPGEFCRDRFGVDLSAEYAGIPLTHPFGKASGQISLNTRQVAGDRAAGLAFTVLKTVIGEDPDGRRTMDAWAAPAAHMQIERITGQDGTPGWTVTWTGRGWSGTLDDYCRFFSKSLALSGGGYPVIPSVKLHLPAEGKYHLPEYRHTLAALQETWKQRSSEPMPLEFDFSPTLAGDTLSSVGETVLGWLREVPVHLRSVAAGSLCLGVKLMNARFDLDYQIAMLRQVGRPDSGVDYLICANRLFDPDRVCDGVRGVAYGGPDLSSRNLAALRQWRSETPTHPPISGTGNILTGRMAAEYARCGASSCQMHTLFQIPNRSFLATGPSRTHTGLMHLLLHPDTGLVATLLEIGGRMARAVSWRDLSGLDSPPE